MLPSRVLHTSTVSSLAYHLEKRRGDVSLYRAVRPLSRKLEGELVELPELVALHEPEVERRQLPFQLTQTTKKGNKTLYEDKENM